MLQRVDILDTSAILEWVVKRQTFMGGFNGRTNKLVDGCYSFWQGGSVVLLEMYFASQSETQSYTDVFDKAKLRDYLLNAGQSIRGGMRDKPEKNVDFYHTCYCLSGLALIEYNYSTIPFRKTGLLPIQPTHPIHNIPPDSLHAILSHFYKD
jgi:protein farnesyltransferase subunit beta